MAVPGAIVQWWNIQVTLKTIIIKDALARQETDLRTAPPLTKRNSVN
jgi:hypothetical protein